MGHWACEAVFYHIYPLGFCGAPERNDFASPETPRLEVLYEWIGHLLSLGVNALYLGPVFESSAHGYDTADYFRVDRRLGNQNVLIELVHTLHEKGIRVILDGVFNHVGRDFWAFRDVREKGRSSAYQDWFEGLSFEGRSPYKDPFRYEGWDGHYDLVKLNLKNPAVKEHLLQAVKMWIVDFKIDGLRLDAADCVDMDFLRELAAFSKGLRPDFWLVGEVVHGDYRKWVNESTLNSVTNYEVYKSLYSSHVDQNYFEIAYALNRQFGEQGLYRGLPLYNFADNHDVNRVASNLKEPAHLYPLYLLLFSIPGIPSIYYGSEWGIQGERRNGSDRQLRPRLELSSVSRKSPNRDLSQTIARLARIRRSSKALKYGRYRQLVVQPEQLAFARETAEEKVIVLVNAGTQAVSMEVSVPTSWGNQVEDLLNPGERSQIKDGKLRVDRIWPAF